MDSQHTITIHAQRHDLNVAIETHDEHHMGASSVFIIPSRPICHVTRFQTTNGNAFFTPEEDGLFIHDACVMLYCDLETGSVHHHVSPRNWYFTQVRLDGLWLLSDLYDASGNRKTNRPIPLGDVTAVFAPGMGSVTAGRFPSAYS